MCCVHSATTFFYFLFFMFVPLFRVWLASSENVRWWTCVQEWTRIHHPTCLVEISTRHKSCPFISLFNCLFCLPICDFDLSIYMYMCVYTHTKWKTYLEFHNDFFFFVVLPPNTKFWLRPSTSRIAIMKVHVQYLKYCKHILALLDYEIYHFEYVVLRT